MPKEKTIKKSALSPTVLIAGGAGFIGSHLAEALLSQNARVIVIDDLSSTGKEVHVESLLKNKNFALYNANINKGIPKEIESVDYIFQLSGVETYLYTQDLGLDSLLANSLGTKNLLDFAKGCEAKFLLVSSTDVYQGVISSLDLENYFGRTESEERKYSLIEAKRYAEALVWEYYKKFNSNVRIVRIPKVYGPRMDLNNGEDLSVAITDLLEDRDITLFGEGTEKNYYLYISDAVAGIVKALFNDETEGKIYSLVPNEPYTSLEMVYLLKSLAHRELNIEFKPKIRTPSSNFLKPDVSNTKGLNWEAKVNFKEGIIKALRWFGYEVNEHTFKPNKIVEQKSKAKQNQTDSIASVIDSDQNQEKTEPKRNVLAGLAAGLASMVSKIKFWENRKPKEPKEPKQKDTVKTIKAQNKYTWMAAFLVLVVVLLFLILPIVELVAYTSSAKNSLEAVPQNVAMLQAELAKENANSSFRNFHKAQNSLARLEWLFTISRQKELYASSQNILGAAKHLSKAAYNTSNAVAPFNDIWTVVRPDSTATLDEQKIRDSNLYLSAAQEDLQLAQAKLSTVNKNLFPQKYQSQLVQIEQAVNVANVNTTLAEEFSKDLPNLLGMEESRKYLILFQNSNEIRPTGGFIGSYAVLELDKGKIVDLKIDDIYNPDGQLDVQDIAVEAPAKLEEFFDEDRLYIRNANWDVNFSDSANTIQDLFFRVDGSEFNGVIAIDLRLAEDLLDITGPIFLTAYNTEITSENLYETAQFESHFNYASGSNSKRSFLTVMGSKLLEKVVSLPKEKTPELAATIVNNLNSKHILLHFNNSSFNAILDQYGWNGNLVSTNGDYLYVVNSNVGGTKANYFVQNKMGYSITSQTRDGVLRGVLNLEYKHNGTDYAWPGGIYKNYVRVFTQNGTKLTGAFVENGEARQDIFEDVEIGREGQYTFYAATILVQPNSTVNVVFEYDLPQALNATKDSNMYNLYWQKQPGTREDTVMFSFTAPFSRDILVTEPKMVVNENNAIYQDILSTDLLVEINY